MYPCATLGGLLRMHSCRFCYRSNIVWFWKESNCSVFAEMKCQKYRRTGAHNTPLFFWCDDQNLWNSALLESAIPRKKTEEKHHKTPVDRKHQRDRSKEGERGQKTRTLKMLFYLLPRYRRGAGKPKAGWRYCIILDKKVVLLIVPLPKRCKATRNRLKVPHHPWWVQWQHTKCRTNPELPVCSNVETLPNSMENPPIYALADFRNQCIPVGKCSMHYFSHWPL